MAKESLKFDTAGLQTTEDFVEEANRVFQANVEEIKGSVHNKLNACEGDIYELFKGEYNRIIQTTLDAAKGSVGTYKGNLEYAEGELTAGTTFVKNTIGG